MGSTLTNTQPKDTYKSLLKTSDSSELSATAKYVSDGNGNDSTLALSTTNVGIGTSSPLAKLDVNGVSQITGDFAGTGQDPLLNFNNTDTSLGISQILGTIDFSQNDPSGGGTGVVSRIRSLNESSFQGEACLTFWTGNAATLAERLRILSNGGITFNGDTAAANALDDYEEGTFNFGINFGGGSAGISFNNRLGAYTKIGRKVTVTGWIRLSSKGSSTGTATISGLPFNIGNNPEYYSSPTIGYLNNITILGHSVSAYGQTGTSYIYIGEEISGVGWSSLSDTDFANNSEMMISFTYFV